MQHLPDMLYECQCRSVDLHVSTFFQKPLIISRINAQCFFKRDIWLEMKWNVRSIFFFFFCNIWAQTREWRVRMLLYIVYMSRDMTKPTKWHVRPAKTQLSLGILPDWSESSLSAWRKLGSLATHWAHSGDSDQTGRMPRLISVFAGRTLIVLALSRILKC